MTTKKLIGLFATLTLLGIGVSAQATTFLADRHIQRGANCATCHKDKAPAPGVKVSQDACLACHGSLDEVAKKTAKLDPNPHYNHLVNLDCLECHRGHQKGVNMCASCHNIKFNVP